MATKKKKYPWERILAEDHPKGFEESEKAYKAFCIYRDLPLDKRNHNGVVEALGKASNYRRTVERWSSRFSWKARVMAYNEHLDEQSRQAWESKLVKRRLEHQESEHENSKTLQQLANRVSEELNQLEQISANPKASELINTIRNNFAEQSKLGRKALNMSEETTTIQTQDITLDQYDFSQFTESEMDTFVKLLEKATKKPQADV